MSDENKLPLVKRAMRLLVEQLTGDDRVSIVVYAGNAGTVLEPTSGASKREILSAIERLESGGSTAVARESVRPMRWRSPASSRTVSTA